MQLVKDPPVPNMELKWKMFWNGMEMLSPPSNFLSFSSPASCSPFHFLPQLYQESKPVLTMSPLKAFFSVMRYKPSVVWILMCLISVLYLGEQHTQVHSRFRLMMFCPSCPTDVLHICNCWHWQNTYAHSKTISSKARHPFHSKWKFGEAI